MVFIGGPRQVGKTTLARKMGDEDWTRSVACVNALAGIPDPAALRASLEELRDANKRRHIGWQRDLMAAVDKFVAMLPETSP